MGVWSTWWAGPTVKGKSQHIMWMTVKVSAYSNSLFIMVAMVICYKHVQC